MPESVTSLGWWSISGESIMEMLQQVAAGADPDLVYAETYANSEHHHVEESDE